MREERAGAGIRSIEGTTQPEDPLGQGQGFAISLFSGIQPTAPP